VAQPKERRKRTKKTTAKRPTVAWRSKYERKAVPKKSILKTADSKYNAVRAYFALDFNELVVYDISDKPAKIQQNIVTARNKETFGVTPPTERLNTEERESPKKGGPAKRRAAVSA